MATRLAMVFSATAGLDDKCQRHPRPAVAACERVSPGGVGSTGLKLWRTPELEARCSATQSVENRMNDRSMTASTAAFHFELPRSSDPGSATATSRATNALRPSSVRLSSRNTSRLRRMPPPRRTPKSTSAACGWASAIPSTRSRGSPVSGTSGGAARLPPGTGVTAKPSRAVIAARTKSSWAVLVHGAAERIGPRFLWQLKHFPPSTTRSSGSPSPPRFSITPKSNRFSRPFHEMNSTDRTCGPCADRAMFTAKNSRPSRFGRFAAAELTPSTCGVMTTRGLASPERRATAENGTGSWANLPSRRRARCSSSPVAGTFPSFASMTAPMAVPASAAASAAGRGRDSSAAAGWGGVRPGSAAAASATAVRRASPSRVGFIPSSSRAGRPAGADVPSR